jgi:hypothetical protein
MPASQNVLLAKGKNVSNALTKKRFVKFDTAAADHETVKACDTVGELAAGVSLFSVSAAEILKGKGASVQMVGIAIVEASVAIAEGQLVSTTNVGKAKVAVATEYVLGVCIEPSTGDTTECAVLLNVPQVL